MYKQAWRALDSRRRGLGRQQASGRQTADSCEHQGKRKKGSTSKTGGRQLAKKEGQQAQAETDGDHSFAVLEESWLILPPNDAGSGNAGRVGGEEKNGNKGRTMIAAG